jgi:hypothetical protein
MRCLADGSGVSVSVWAASSPRCHVVDSTKSFKFGECAEITPGSLYRKFTACVSGAHATSDAKTFVVLLGVLMSTVMMMTGSF